jgi:putative membrane protein
MDTGALPRPVLVIAGAVTSGPWWSAWVLDLPALAMVTGLSVLYLRGAAARSARGVARPRRTAAFLAGAGVVLLGQVSPVAAWSEVLLWPHMVQHLMITIVAAPLLAFGAPVTTVRIALPPAPRRVLAHASRRTRRWRRTVGVPPLLLATVVQIAALWVWHTPIVYDAAVANAGLHLLEHATFLATAVWFWSEVWATARRNHRVQALATVCLGAMIAQGAVLGALLSFAGRSLFDVYDGFGDMTALQDQQFAGGLMWVPPGFVYGPIAIRRFIRWINMAETDLRRREVRARDRDEPCGQGQSAAEPTPAVGHDGRRPDSAHIG